MCALLVCGWLGFTGMAQAQTASEVFEEHISPLVQRQCINCHVQGGQSGNTRLVFLPSTDATHLVHNEQQFRQFISEVDGGAERILDKISGRISHGGGTQVPEDSDEYGRMAQYLELLAGGSESNEIIPDPGLRRAIANALNKSAEEPITEEELATLVELQADGNPSATCAVWNLRSN